MPALPVIKMNNEESKFETILSTLQHTKNNITDVDANILNYRPKTKSLVILSAFLGCVKML